ncbi:uncharacterized protein LOC131217111 [Magnolia sinica]|uniref:uncharacterized protein LOC131217111 n=1 Tax=Magnolia sinica TaxID=86752 RepID=UPI002658C8F3|nr:uncharacterized protein LOC131217111 [Magnolia sinica]
MNSSSFASNGAFLLFSSTQKHSVSNTKWGLQSELDMSMSIQRSNRPTFRVLAKANAAPGKRSSTAEVIMVDPLEAKRLAAKQMQEIKAKEKFKRQRQIEAINGAWAMIGLTAGLVIEGHTGNGILAQLTGYWNAITSFFWW